MPALLDSRIIQDKVQQLISLQNTSHVGLTMPSDTAARMFDEIVVWTQQSFSRSHPFDDSFVKRFNDDIRSHAGQLLTIVVVPAIRPEERTEERAQALLGFIARERSWTSLGALPYFVASAP